MHTGRLAQERLAEADSRLNAVYREALTKIDLVTDRPGLRKEFVEAQRAWIQFRDKNCTAEGRYSGGVQMWQSTYHVMCLARLTETRVQELEQIFNR